MQSGVCLVKLILSELKTTERDSVCVCVRFRFLPDIEACVATLVRHQVLAVEKKRRVMKHPLKVHKRRPAVRFPSSWQVKVLPVPGRVTWHVPVVLVRLILSKIAILRYEIVRGCAKTPLSFSAFPYMFVPSLSW